MEMIQTETNRGNKAILVEGILYQKKNVLKNGDIVYVCSAGNVNVPNLLQLTKMDYLLQRNAADILKITCNVETSDQKTETHQLHVRVRKQSGYISRKPITIVRYE